MTAAILKEVKLWLDENGWNYNSFDEADILELNMRLQCEWKNCKVLIWNTEDSCIIVGKVSAKVDESARRRVAEYLCRINYGLNMGHFDLNFDDGEIRYKTYLPVSMDALTQKINIEEALIRPAVMFDAYVPGLLKVWREDRVPVEVIEEC